MVYTSETDKIRETVLKYIGDITIDIGCFDSKIADKSLGINTDLGPLVSLRVENYSSISSEAPELINFCDTIFSSHLIYTFENWISVIDDWKLLLKEGGKFVFYLPDERLWDYGKNIRTVHRFQYESFCSLVMSSFADLHFVDGGFDIGADKYSFFVVLEKKADAENRFFERKLTHKLNRITESDYESLRKIYDSTNCESNKRAIQAAVDEIEYLTRKLKI